MIGFHQAFSCGVLLLLVLMSTTFVHRAGAYSSELTDSPVTSPTTEAITDPTEAPTTSETDVEEECTVEQTACVADETCLSCATADAQSTTCGELVDASNSSQPTETCADNMEIACCIDELADVECLDNEAFTVGVLCFMEALGCPVDEVTCAEAGDSDGAEDGADIASDGATTANSLGHYFFFFLCAHAPVAAYLSLIGSS